MGWDGAEKKPLLTIYLNAEPQLFLDGSPGTSMTETVHQLLVDKLASDESGEDLGGALLWQCDNLIM